MAFDVTIEGGMIKVLSSDYPVYAHPTNISIIIGNNNTIVTVMDSGRSIASGAFGDYDTPSEASAVLLADAIAALIPA